MGERAIGRERKRGRERKEEKGSIKVDVDSMA